MHRRDVGNQLPPKRFFKHLSNRNPGDILTRCLNHLSWLHSVLWGSGPRLGWSELLCLLSMHIRNKRIDGSPAPYVPWQSNSKLMQNIIRVQEDCDNEKQKQQQQQEQPVFILMRPVIMWIHNMDMCRTSGPLQQPVTVAEIRLKVAAATLLKFRFPTLLLPLLLLLDSSHEGTLWCYFVPIPSATAIKDTACKATYPL